LVSSANIRPARKDYTGTNTLAYFAVSDEEKTKLMTLTPGGGVALETVDDGLVALHDPHNVAAQLVPAEELAVVRSGDDELTVAEKRRTLCQIVINTS
jgi:hypothetical protein